jgi:hypothetical protein
MFTCVGTETQLLSFLGKEVKYLMCACEMAVCSFSSYVRVWKRTSNSASGGNIWLLLGVCDELIPRSETERFFRLQQPVFKCWFLQITLHKNLMTVRSR